nr:reverse transcriptase domain-containing protein [Tanacetum cinerariifolium]
MFPKESDEVEKYVGGLSDMIQGSVMASKPKSMQDAIEFATDLMDQNICTFADRQAENKRKLDDNSRNNNTQQQPHKRQNVARAYTAGSYEKREYERSLPLCPKCNYHHNGQCAPKCNNSKNLAIWLVIVEVHLLLLTTREPPGRTRGLPLVLNVMYVPPKQPLDHDYDVELADKKIIRVNTIIWGCTLNFLNHPFNIDLMPIEFSDVIIGMDWFSMYHAVIVYDEKIVRIPFGNETIIVRGDRSNNGHESRLNIISCTKSQKYLLKGCDVFLAHVTINTDALSISSVRDERIVGSTARTFQQRLYKTQFLTLGSSCLFCQEEGRIIQMCIDYQELNKLMVKNRYSLPSIDDLFDQLQGWSVYSKIDLRSAMSSASSAVTYTFVYTNSYPGRSVAPPSPNYIPGLEEPHDPNYIPEPIYPEYIPWEYEHVFPVEEQPLPPVDSPTTESPGYAAESDLEEDPKEYEDDET